jgi:GTPase SAR1 family protein
MAPIYYKEAKGAVLVYDITDTVSFDRVVKWVKELKS